MADILENYDKYAWAASIYWGGDGPCTVFFENQKERDNFVATHDYCDKGKRWNVEYLGYWGIHAKQIGDKFIDKSSGVEL